MLSVNLIIVLAFMQLPLKTLQEDTLCQKKIKENEKKNNDFIHQCDENGLFKSLECNPDASNNDRCKCVYPLTGSDISFYYFMNDSCDPGPGETLCQHLRALQKTKGRENEADCESNGTFKRRQTILYSKYDSEKKPLKEPYYNVICVNPNTGELVRYAHSLTDPCMTDPPSTTSVSTREDTTMESSSKATTMESTSKATTMESSSKATTTSSTTTEVVTEMESTEATSPTTTSTEKPKCFDVRQTLKEDKNWQGYWPVCDKNGSFSEIQCRFNKKPKLKPQCYCVTANGIILENVETISKETIRKCRKSRNEKDWSSKIISDYYVYEYDEKYEDKSRYIYDYIYYDTSLPEGSGYGFWYKRILLYLYKRYFKI